VTHTWDHRRKLGDLITVKKGLHINALGRFYIYKIANLEWKLTTPTQTQSNQFLKPYSNTNILPPPPSTSQ
jgi:hypothetical protein